MSALCADLSVDTVLLVPDGLWCFGFSLDFQRLERSRLTGCSLLDMKDVVNFPWFNVGHLTFGPPESPTGIHFVLGRESRMLILEDKLY